MILTIDSFAWIEIIRGTRTGRKSRDIIEASEACFTPAIVLAEVAHRCIRDGFDDSFVQEELQAMTEASLLVPIDSGVSIAASKATAKLLQRARTQHLPPPGLGDGLVLATAWRFGSSILTGDPHFRGLPETVWLE